MKMSHSGRSRIRVGLSVCIVALVTALTPFAALSLEQSTYTAWGRWTPSQSDLRLPTTSPQSQSGDGGSSASTFLALVSSCGLPGLEFAADHMVASSAGYSQVGTAYPVLDCNARFDRVRLEVRVGDDGVLPTSKTVSDGEVTRHEEDPTSPDYAPLTVQQVNELVQTSTQTVLLHYGFLDIHGPGSRMWWQAELHLVTTNGDVGFVCARQDAIYPEDAQPQACEEFFTPPSLNGVGL